MKKSEKKQYLLSLCDKLAERKITDHERNELAFFLFDQENNRNYLRLYDKDFVTIGEIKSVLISNLKKGK